MNKVIIFVGKCGTEAGDLTILNYLQADNNTSSISDCPPGTTVTTQLTETGSNMGKLISLLWHETMTACAILIKAHHKADPLYNTGAWFLT